MAKATVTDVNHRANLRVGNVRDVYTHFVGAFFLDARAFIWKRFPVDVHTP